MAIAITDRFLNEVTQTWFDDYQYFGVGTGTTVFLGTDTDLNIPQQIGGTSALRNKVYDSGSTSFITSGSTSFVHLFKLNTLEPNTQPVNLRELGTFKTLADNNDMGNMQLLNVAQTKDNTVQWNVRFQGRVRRIS